MEAHNSNTMKLQYCSIQGNGIMNEDTAVMNEREKVYAVIDGATSITSYRNELGHTGGYIAAHTLASRLQYVSPQDRIEDVVLQANQELRHKMEEAGIDDREKSNFWSTAFVVFRIHDTYIEYAQAGDCMLFAKYKDGALRIISRDQVAHVDRLTLQKRQDILANGDVGKETLFQLLYPTFYENRQKANTLDGYAVMNGEECLSDFIETGRFNRSCLTRLYAVTDGLFHCTEESDPDRVWKDMIARIDRMGLEAYATDLVQLEQSDSDCKQVPRLKISDDKTGIVVDLT